MDSVAEGNVEVWYLSIILNVAIRGSLKYVFIVLDMVVEPSDLFFEVVYFAGFMGFMLSNC